MYLTSIDSRALLEGLHRGFFAPPSRCRTRRDSIPPDDPQDEKQCKPREDRRREAAPPIPDSRDTYDPARSETSRQEGFARLRAPSGIRPAHACARKKSPEIPG